MNGGQLRLCASSWWRDKFGQENERGTTAMPADGIFSAGFKPEPYWWEAFAPVTCSDELPQKADVAIIGGGYAGLSVARELADRGRSVAIIDAQRFGEGASTRSGGSISAGPSIGKSFSGKVLDLPGTVVAQAIEGAKDAYVRLQQLLVDEQISCSFEERGRLLVAVGTSGYAALEKRLDKLRSSGAGDCHLVPRERLREEIGSDYYAGGLVFDTAGKLHPALFYKGLLEACRRREAISMTSHTAAERVARQGEGFAVKTSRGTIAARHVVVATNGYSGRVFPPLTSRVVPVASSIIATEPLPPDVLAAFSPKGRTFTETSRMMHYFRLAPDGSRVVFGGRARFMPSDPRQHARILHQRLVRRFPHFEGVKLTHAWHGNVAFTTDTLPHFGQFDGVHFLAGCNGSGVAMMPYLGALLAARITGENQPRSVFETHPMGQFPLLSATKHALPIAEAWFRFRDSLEQREHS
jgi:glycine/D-amino acid oxidase-like deaminating enzyme